MMNGQVCRGIKGMFEVRVYLGEPEPWWVTQGEGLAEPSTVRVLVQQPGIHASLAQQIGQP